MQPIRTLDQYEQLKLLADPRRLQILRILMSKPASLTLLGKELGEHPAWIRHHLIQLEKAGLVEFSGAKPTSGRKEIFYRASCGGLILQKMVLANDPEKPAIVFSGSHDLAVELLAETVAPYAQVLFLPVGSLDGLITLRQNFSQISGCHLLDNSGEYNVPFIHHFFPDRDMQLVTLAYREQGLIVLKGNPKGIRDLSSLVGPNVIFVNRNPGSGTRLWLDSKLEELGINQDQILGYSTCVSTHTECAKRIKSGKADAAIGLRAAAQIHGLDFIPLFRERYDVAFPCQHDRSLNPLLDVLQTSSFKNKMHSLAGYETSHTGEQIL